MKVFCDTNVLVAAFLQSHPHHNSARPVVERVQAGRDQGFVATHSLAEAYAVLTRLPGGQRAGHLGEPHRGGVLDHQPGTNQNAEGRRGRRRFQSGQAAVAPGDIEFDIELAAPERAGQLAGQRPPARPLRLGEVAPPGCG